MALALEGTTQHKNVTTGTTIPIPAFTTTQASEVFIAATINGTSVSSITPDPTGGTWAKVASVPNGGDPIELWAAKSSGAISAQAYTVNLVGSTSFATGDVFAFSGQDTSTVFDGNAAIPATATGSPVTFSTSNANDVIIAVFRMSSGAAPSAGNIAGSAATSIASGDFQMCEYRIVSATQSSQTATVGSGTSNGGIVDAVMQATSSSRPVKMAGEWGGYAGVGGGFAG